MTSLFSSLLTFMKSTYFRTRHTGNLDRKQVFRLYISAY
ncbi:hypothetical protein PARMER_00285 [Parabacteroides merdae ATCC 43184]|nr:hypothetical protein PARMER_00285 [Parabacteroides merdae ATCC 43184]